MGLDLAPSFGACFDIYVSFVRNNFNNFILFTAVLHRSLKGDDEDELFNQALSTVNKVDTRTLELLQKAVSNSSARVPRQIVSSSAVYTPPEFEPVKKKSRNFDHEDTVLRKFLKLNYCKKVFFLSSIYLPETF